MSLPDTYLHYSQRHYGMDHTLYPWSDLFERTPVVWPNGARIALWVMPIMQWFPLNMKGKPFKAPGALTMPFPDFRHYTNRDYGNRVGIFRLLRLLKSLNVPSSVAMNSAIAERYPALVKELAAFDIEVLAHGVDMDTLHYTGLSLDQEAAQIDQALTTLRHLTGQPVTGWLSPGRAQSDNTPTLLAQQGVRYSCDWANDDLPYVMQTSAGDHVAMPMAYETDDRFVMLEMHQSDVEWAQQIKDRFDVLYRESAEYGGRVMSLPLHAWVAGVPYRTPRVREVLEYILGHEGVWAATGSQILDAFQASGGAHHGAA